MCFYCISSVLTSMIGIYIRICKGSSYIYIFKCISKAIVWMLIKKSNNIRLIFNASPSVMRRCHITDTLWTDQMTNYNTVWYYDLKHCFSCFCFSTLAMVLLSTIYLYENNIISVKITLIQNIIILWGPSTYILIKL